MTFILGICLHSQISFVASCSGRSHLQCCSLHALLVLRTYMKARWAGMGWVQCNDILIRLASPTAWACYGWTVLHTPFLYTQAPGFRATVCRRDPEGIPALRNSTLCPGRRDPQGRSPWAFHILSQGNFHYFGATYVWMSGNVFVFFHKYPISSSSHCH